jgi:hypothetical protein
MVRMMMGDENVPELWERQAGPHHLARNAVAAVDDVDISTGDNRLGAVRTVLSDARPTRSAEQHKPRMRISSGAERLQRQKR